MGIFDIIEIRNHLDAINEYLLYIDSCKSRDTPFSWSSCLATTNLISGHVYNIRKVLDKMEEIG